MGTVRIQSLIDRVQTILQDETNTRWTSSELLKWFNDGQREVVVHRPDAYAVNADFEIDSTSSGNTRQEAPAGALKLMSVVRNNKDAVVADPTATPPVAASEAVRRAITRIERAVLDEQVPNWHSEDANLEVKHYVYDERDPKHFYLYPPPAENAVVEIIYSQSPPDNTIADQMLLDDIYANAIMDYMIFRAYSKDADYAGNAQRAVAHFQSFATSIGAKISGDVLLAKQASGNDGTPSAAQ